MSFSLINLQFKGSPEDCFYIFDSNVLLPQLGLFDDNGTYAPFLSFLSKVIKKTEVPDSKVRIFITDLQLSELFNKLLRYQARIQWDQGGKRLEADFNLYYKAYYRKSDEFEQAFENIKSDFDAIAHAFTVVKLSRLSTFEELTDFNPKKLDFNDNHLLHTAIEFDAVLVSNDRDFYGQPIRLATYNSNMIQQNKMDVMLQANAAKLKK